MVGQTISHSGVPIAVRTHERYEFRATFRFLTNSPGILRPSACESCVDWGHRRRHLGAIASLWWSCRLSDSSLVNRGP